MKTQEIWKDVVGYEGYYKVSNLGNVKRINHYRGVNFKYRDNHYLTGQDNGKGYLRVKLNKQGKTKSTMVHRIIAEAFIENPNNYKVVHHIDGNKTNNSIDNLMWCTQSYNVKIDFINGVRSHKNSKRINEKKVICVKTGVIYKSIAEAARENKIDRGTLLYKLNGKKKNNTTFLLI